MENIIDIEDIEKTQGYGSINWNKLYIIAKNKDARGALANFVRQWEALGIFEEQFIKNKKLHKNEIITISGMPFVETQKDAVDIINKMGDHPAFSDPIFRKLFFAVNGDFDFAKMIYILGKIPGLKTEVMNYFSASIEPVLKERTVEANG